MPWIFGGGRNKDKEAEVQQWIEAVTGERWPEGVEYGDYLSDGVALCKLMNRLSPGSVKRINTSGSSFTYMDNIHGFLDAVKAYGCPENDLFEGSDLLQNKNIENILTRAVMAVARQAYSHAEWKGPFLGPRPAEQNVPHFSPETAAQSSSTTPMQMGSNKGASQAGQSFGKPRRIIIGK